MVSVTPNGSARISGSRVVIRQVFSTGTQRCLVTRELAETAGTLADTGHHKITFDLFALEDRVAMDEAGSIVPVEMGIISQFFVEKRAEFIGREPERVFRIKGNTVHAEDHERYLSKENGGITR